MNLKEKINTDFMVAFKAKEMDKKNFLGLLKSEIQNEEGRGKLGTDDVVIGILRKMEKALLQTNTAGALNELSYMAPYLPKLMSEDQIKPILNGYIANGLNNVGALMGAFNKDYKGLADNKLVSVILKELLN